METLNTLKYANRARNIKNKVSPGNSLAYVVAFNAGDTFSLLSVGSLDQTIATPPCNCVVLEDSSRSTNVLHSNSMMLTTRMVDVPISRAASIF